MREIKFRAWDGRKMTETFTLHYDGTVATRISPLLPNAEIEPLKLMQYTGLKDVNGKEIYEGDIVRFFEVHCEYCKDRLYQVAYVDCVAAFQLYDLHTEGMNDIINFDTDMDLPDDDNIQDEVEVIGNIYANPELMEGK